MYGEIEYDLKCETESCGFLTNDERDISLCEAKGCTKVNLCPDCTYVCDLCTWTYCASHVHIISGPRRDDIVCHACAARIIAVAA
jgi:hypothetical protein